MKLFKKIRQALIKEGNLKRYLLYALGEILLVMIGISLAFQVSNWDNNRIKRNDAHRYYENIKDQILDEKELILEQMHFNNRFMSQFEYATHIIESDDRSKIDTLGIIIRNLSQYSDFDKRGNIYETMVNSGQINLLQNQEIVNSIRELEERYTYINRMESIHYDVVIQHTVGSISPVLDYTTARIQHPDLVYTNKFQNLLYITLQIMEEKKRTYNNATAEIDHTLHLLKQELQN